jgi:hypothetical protein
MASSRGTGLILRSIKVDYKFVSYMGHLYLYRLKWMNPLLTHGVANDMARSNIGLSQTAGKTR